MTIVPWLLRCGTWWSSEVHTYRIKEFSLPGGRQYKKPGVLRMVIQNVYYYMSTTNFFIKRTKPLSLLTPDDSNSLNVTLVFHSGSSRL